MRYKRNFLILNNIDWYSYFYCAHSGYLFAKALFPNCAHPSYRYIKLWQKVTMLSKRNH